MTSPLLAALASAKAAEAAAAELKKMGLLGPPRSWDGIHKFHWFQLSPELKKYTTAREDARDAALRKAQNKLAAMRAALQKENTNVKESATPARPDRTDTGQATAQRSN